jgi:dolichol-phosphate mannosyltransferase
MCAIALADRDSLVIVPTYNEIDNLGRLVRAVLDQNQVAEFNLLVVDDNSPDGTGQLADLLAAEHPDRMAVIHRDGKLGLGTAYVEGFRYALQHGYSHVFEMDADFSHDPATLQELRCTLEDADLVLGSRYVDGGSAPGQSTWRRMLSRLGSMYASTILGLPLRDVTGGFKGFRAGTLAALDLQAIRSNGYAFQIEVTYRAFSSGLRVVEQPITFGPRLSGHSKMRLGIICEALIIVWRLRFTSQRSRQSLCWPPPAD